MNYTHSSASMNTTINKHTLKSLLFFGALVVFLGNTHNAFAQTNSVSPLSINGIGETSFGITPTYLGLGGTGIAYSDRYTINMMNPAGYMNMEYATLEMSGAHRSFRHTISADSVDQLNYNTYFDYFGFGFKFSDWIAGSFSLSPFAAKGYSISVADSSDDFGDYEYRSIGSGGYDKFTFGLAVRPVEWFSLGANVKYIFGETTQSDKTIIVNPAFLSVSKTQKIGISDFSFDIGTQLQGKTGNYKIAGGAVYGFGRAMNAREITTQYSFINSGIVETPIDTLFYNLSENGTVTLPTSYGIGIGISKIVENVPVNAWDIVVDYRVTNWEEFKSFTPFGATPSQSVMLSSKRISAGAVMVPLYLFPALKRSSNYLTVARYRIGAFQEYGQYRWDEDAYTSREVNIGMSMPVVYRSLAPGEQKASFLNISIGRGQRWDGNTANLKEDYWNFNLGITLNDKWFQKFKYR